MALSLSVSLVANQDSQKKQVVIIGGGAIGLFAAKFAVDLGHDVTIIDKGEMAKGTSLGNSGYVVPSLSLPVAGPGLLSKRVLELVKRDNVIRMRPRMSWAYAQWVYQHIRASSKSKYDQSSALLLNLGQESMDLYESLASELELEGFERHGRYMFFDDKKGYESAISDIPRLNKYDILATDGNQSWDKNLDQFLKTGSYFGSVHYMGDGHISPHKFFPSLVRHLRDKGVKMLENTHIGLSYEGGDPFIIKNKKIVSITTNNGSIPTDELIIATGHQTPGLLKALDIHNILIQPGAGYSITVKELDNQPKSAIMFADEHITMTPMGNDWRLASAIILGENDPTIDPTIVDLILKKASRYLTTDLTTYPRNKMTVWKGFRPCTPDDMPYIGRHKKYSNLIIAAGHGTLGIHLAPVTGKIVGEILDDKARGLNLSGISPNRF